MLPHNLDALREAPWCAIDLPIHVERHGASFDGRTRDLSVGGLAVTLPDDAPVAFRSRWLTTAPLERALRAYAPALTQEDK